MIDDKKRIGERIKERREEMNLSAWEVAEQLGLSKATIHRYESGEIKKIKLPIIESIASILKVNPDWLIGKSEDKYKISNIEYVEKTGAKDIKKVLGALSEYVAANANLEYDNQPLTAEARRNLLIHIETVINITDKIYNDDI